MYLFFDTETNGKIKDWKLPMTKVDNFPRITQIAIALFDEDKVLCARSSFLIKPDGWTIPKEKFFIDNNMSSERCEEFGIPIKSVLLKFLSIIENAADYLIAHNLDFDYPVIGAEMIRLGLKTNKITKKICTMKSTIDFCKIPFKNQHPLAGFKYPKLEELHKILFNEDIKDAHDALGDVLTTAKCFFKLKELGVIKI